jgi:hypothetical protein
VEVVIYWKKVAEVDWRHGVVRRSEQCPLSSCSGPNCMGLHGEGLYSKAKVSVRDGEDFSLDPKAEGKLLRVRSREEVCLKSLEGNL